MEMPDLRRWSVPAAAAVLVSLAAGGALAAAKAPPRRLSEVETIRKLIEDANFEQALKSIDRALSRPDQPTSLRAQLLKLQATTYLFLGKDNLARQSFEALLVASPEFELPPDTSGKLRTLWDEVRPVGSLKVVCPSGSSVNIQGLTDYPVPCPFFQERVRVGTYTVTLEGAARGETATAVVPRGGMAKVELDRPERTPERVPGRAKPVEPDPEVEEHARAEEGEGGPALSVAGWVVGSVGVAALVSGFGVGAAAKSKHNEARGTCSPGGCSPAAQQQSRDAVALGNVGTGLAVVGSLAAAVGVTLLIVGHVRAAAPEARLHFMGTPQGGLVALEGSF
jgi:hypothetical protein